MAQLNFDASQVQPNTGTPDPIPSGWYPMVIKNSEMKPTKDKQGAYLELEFEVIDGEYKGRKVWDRLNLQNKNPVAVEIAYGSLSAICHAAGIIQVQDSQQLHGIPMEVKVGLREADGNYDASNDVKGYRQLAGPGQQAANPQGFQQPAPQQQQQPAPQQSAAPPWNQQPAAPPQGQAAPWNQQQPQAGPAAQQPGDKPPWAQ
jgi:hypothetical protein